MKKLITLTLALFLSAATFIQPAAAALYRQAPQQHLTKSGKPDKRYNENKHLKKDGTPDMRYKSSKKAATKQKKS